MMGKRADQKVTTPEQVNAALMKRYGKTGEVAKPVFPKTISLKELLTPETHRSVKMGAAKQVLSNQLPGVQAK